VKFLKAPSLRSLYSWLLPEQTEIPAVSKRDYYDYFLLVGLASINIFGRTAPLDCVLLRKL